MFPDYSVSDVPGLYPERSNQRWCRQRDEGSGRGRLASAHKSDWCARPRPHLFEALQHNASRYADTHPSQ